MPYIFSMRLALSLVLLVLSLAALPAVAGAQATNAPPGLSGVDEYLETVPSAGGAQTPGGGKPGGGSLDDPEVAAQADRVVGAEAVAKLKRQGADGARAAALAATGAPPQATVGGASTSVTLGDTGDASTVGQILTVLTGGAGAGAVLPLSLLPMTVLLAAAAVRRRRPLT